MALLLHAAACGSKAVIVPTAAWARAYADALGAPACFSIVTVQPTWLGFDDLWRGGLARSWERAGLDPSAIEIVLLRDFNRALPQCYARPVLDVIAGFADALPDPGCGGWPDNLRLFACPSPPEEAFPLTVEVTRHFAAIQRSTPGAADQRAGQLMHGHAPAATWLSWCGPSAPTAPDDEMAREFGPLAGSAAADISAISRILQANGMNQREANRTAIDVRVADPAEYADQNTVAAGAVK